MTSSINPTQDELRLPSFSQILKSIEIPDSAVQSSAVPERDSSVENHKDAGTSTGAKIPAVILADGDSAAMRIAGLAVLDRLVVAIFRGGVASITIVARQTLPPLPRSRALGIRFNISPSIPSLEGPVLLASANLLVQPHDVRQCLDQRARLLSSDGHPLDIGVTGPLCHEGALEKTQTLPAMGVALPVRNPATAASAEKALWASLTSSADGAVDKYFNRPCGRILSKMLIHTSISPNVISVASIVIGVISAFFFAAGTYREAVIGALIFQLSAIIDCIDGDIARVLFKESPLGKWIDFAGDQVVHISVFAGIALGVSRSAATPELLWLGLSAVVGALLSFAVVLRGMRSPGGQSSILQKLIDAATNRDFSVLVLILAICARLDLFLWMAAIGSHLFWIAALALQLTTKSPAPTAPSRPYPAVKTFLKILLLCAGLALFGWYLSGIGLEAVWSAILSLGPWAPLVLLPYFIVYNVDCLAWAQTLPRKTPRIPFLNLLRIRWSGESLNNLVPSAYVGGETLKVLLLRPHGVTASEGTTSAVISKTAQTVAQLVFVLTASAVFLLIAQDQPGLRVALAFVCAGGIAAVGALFWAQSVGIFRMFTSLTKTLRLRLRAFESRQQRLLELDATILRFYRKKPRRFYASTGLYFCGWLLDTVEIYLVAHLLDMPITWAQALVMEAFTGVAKVLGMWIPGSLGVQESGIVLLGRLAGLPDTLSAAYALIRRARELIFVAIGMLLLYCRPSSMKAAEAAATATQKTS